MPIRLVVDSSSDLDPSRAADYRIAVVPLTVSFGDEIFLDFIDMTPEMFYERLAHSPILPKTSMPTISQFDETYRRLIAEGATEIISAHLSIHFSGTYNVARIAAQTVQEETGIPIHVLDSKTVSAGISLPMLHAVKMIDEGATSDQILTYLNGAWERGRIYILLNTLANLERSGRIGKAQAIVGTLLNIKPILTFVNGEVTPLERVRTHSKAIARIGEFLRDLPPLEAAGIATSDLGVHHELHVMIRTVYDGPIESFSFGPVVGTSAGLLAGGIYVIPRE
jgi:DegV family protein with EDD domain